MQASENHFDNYNMITHKCLIFSVYSCGLMDTQIDYKLPSCACEKFTVQLHVHVHWVAQAL